MLGEAQQATFDSQAQAGLRQPTQAGELSNLGIRA